MRWLLKKQKCSLLSTKLLMIYNEISKTGKFGGEMMKNEGTYSLSNFANFVFFFVLRTEKPYHKMAKMYRK